MNLFVRMFLVFAFLFAQPLSLVLQEASGSQLVLGGSFTLAEGQKLDGSLMVVGGTVVLAQSSIVQGDILMMGGSLEVSGTVTGSVVSLGGLARLTDTAIIQGDLIIPAGNLERATGAQISGKINQGTDSLSPITLPGGVRIPNIQVNYTPFWYGFSILSILFQSFIWAALAALVVVLLPRQTEVTAQAFVSQPVLSGGLGLLTTVVAPLLLVVSAITIIGIPLTIVGAFMLVVGWAFGVIALGTELGKRLAVGLKQNLALAVSAALGTFIMTLVVNSLQLIPCVGWIGMVVVGVLGLGAVILTRFGTQHYHPPSTLSAISQPPGGVVPPGVEPSSSTTPPTEPTA